VGHEEDALGRFNMKEEGDHGLYVTEVVGTVFPKHTYHLIRGIPPGGDLLESHLLMGLSKVDEMGKTLDVMNISAEVEHLQEGGIDCTGTGADCPIHHEISRLSDEYGITFVASTGNEPHVEFMTCPGLSDTVIGVGGCVIGCGASGPLPVPYQHDSGNGGLVDITRYQMMEQLYPPKAAWVRNEHEYSADAAFCSGLDCFVGEICDENRTTTIWDGNVEPVNGKPDLYASVTYPLIDTETGVRLDQGTSFSAPLVTGQVAEAVGMLTDLDRSFDNIDVKRKLRTSTEMVDDQYPGMLNGGAFVEGIADDFDIEIHDDQGESGPDGSQLMGQ